MKKIFLFFLFFCSLLIHDLVAQQYDSAVGLRFGVPNSISYKKFLGDVSVVEFSAGTRGFNSGFLSTLRYWSFTGSYQIQKELGLGDIDGLDYYYGGGGIVFLWTFNDSFYNDQFSSTTLGIQGYLGLSYTFDDIPLNITLDWVPTILIGNGFVSSGVGFGFGSLGARYVISR